MIFPRDILRNDHDDFADLGGVPVDDPFADLGGVEVPSQAERAEPEMAAGEIAQQPTGTLQTGHVSRRLVLPEMTGLERPGDDIGDATEVEDHEVRAPTWYERMVDMDGFAQPLRQSLMERVGLDAPNAQSTQRAVENGGSLSDRISALVPTAARPEGMRSDVTDRRTQAGAMGFGTGLPIMGEWLDEAQGVSDALTGGDYTEGRDRARAMRAQAQAQAPEASLMGSVAPNIALGLAGGPTAGTALGRIGQAGVVGAGLGSWAGAGAADDWTQIPEQIAEQGAIGGATAAGLQGAGEGVSWLAPRVAGLFNRAGEGVEDMAAAEALRARGLPTNAQPNTAWGRQVQRMGGERGLADALARENVGGLFPSPGQSASEADRLLAQGATDLESAHATMRAAGDRGRIDPNPLIEDLQAQAAELRATPTGPDQAAAGRIERSLLRPLLTEEGAGAAQQARPMSFEEAHRLRRAYDRIANFRNASPAQGTLMDAARSARTDLSGLMTDALETASPEAAEAWARGNQRYQLGAALRDYSRAQGSQLPGAVAEGIGGMGGGLTGRVARGVVSNYGPALRMRGLQTLVPMLRSLGGGAERFAQILEQSGSNEALAGTHFILSQTNPEYRRAVQAAEEQEEQQQ